MQFRFDVVVLFRILENLFLFFASDKMFLRLSGRFILILNFVVTYFVKNSCGLIGRFACVLRLREQYYGERGIIQFHDA
jgi:hypothetical protein